MWLGGVALEVVGVVLWRGFFWCYGFHTSAAEFCKFNQTADKKCSHFMLLGVYADITIGRITRYQSSVVSVQKLKVKLAPVGAVMFGVFRSSEMYA